MNLVRVGERAVNMDLVQLVEIRPGGGVTVTFAIGGTLELEGAEAASLRRFIVRHSRAPEDGEPPCEPPPAEGRKYTLDHGEDLDGPGLAEGEQGR